MAGVFGLRWRRRGWRFDRLTAVVHLAVPGVLTACRHCPVARVPARRNVGPLLSRMRVSGRPVTHVSVPGVLVSRRRHVAVTHVPVAYVFAGRIGRGSREGRGFVGVRLDLERWSGGVGIRRIGPRRLRRKPRAARRQRAEQYRKKHPRMTALCGSAMRRRVRLGCRHDPCPPSVHDRRRFRVGTCTSRDPCFRCRRLHRAL